MDDIAPALLDAVQKQFATNQAANPEITALLDLLAGGGADYAAAEKYATMTGQSLAAAFGQCVTSAALPDEKMYWNIAERVVQPMLEGNYKLASTYAERVQQALNRAAGLGLKAQKPRLNKNQIKGLLNKLCAAEQFDDAAKLLDEPVVTFTQRVVDAMLKQNIAFQGAAGLKPTVTRRVVSGCCEWCSNMAGTYTYPDIPPDMFRRHERCRCVVTYNPGDGRKKVQDVWSKRWTGG